ncbi:SMa0974 family conjugal transfer regulator [Sinorhizobium chiapasense]|uniref:Uncharacterized protein n=1 Tax=Sinorhizobium chiapasense TaxID=501572 RepID=A0ABZ2BGW5_9HYPH
MYKQTVEAFIAVSNAPMIAGQILARVGQFCQSAVLTETESRLEFGEAQAIIKPVAEGLLFWVAASDELISNAIQALLQGSVFLIAPTSDTGAIQWYASNGKPFETIRSQLVGKRIKAGRA